jgi:hypothetical protein
MTKTAKGDEEFLLERVKHYKEQVKKCPGLTDKQKMMLIALPYSRGIVARASQLTGLSREVHHDSMRTNEDYKRFYYMIQEDRMDFVEECLMRAIGNQDASLIKYYLSCKGKERGYLPDNQINISVAPVTFNLVAMTPPKPLSLDVPITESIEVPASNEVEKQIDGTDNQGI